MAENEIEFDKKITWTIIISVCVLMFGAVQFAFSQGTRITVIENNEVRNELIFKDIKNSLVSLHDKVDKLAEGLAYERGKDSGG